MMESSKKDDESNGDYEMTGGKDDPTEQLIPSMSDGLTMKRATKPKAGRVVVKKVRKVLKKKDTSAADKLIKYSALFLLVAQMVGLVLLMRFSRTHQNAGQPLYLASSAVFVMEVMKFVICCVVIAYQTGGNLIGELNLHVLHSPMEMVKLCVPSLLYTVQNNLLYLALTNLDAATYQVCYQLKILTTALFSAILLQRKFSSAKWFSLVVLTTGVAIVQISGSGDHHASSDNKHNRLVGLVAVLCAACTSGFSGVYFEKILKGSQTTLWMRNVQMGLPSIIIALFTVYAKDGADVSAHGMLGGFSPMVWTVVTVQAAGGLIVAVVVKYADNVLKVFATSFSIIISCMISAIFFDFHANFTFIIGAGLVVIATAIYSAPDSRAKSPLLPMSTTPRKTGVI